MATGARGASAFTPATSAHKVPARRLPFSSSTRVGPSSPAQYRPLFGIRSVLCSWALAGNQSSWKHSRARNSFTNQQLFQCSCSSLDSDLLHILYSELGCGLGWRSISIARTRTSLFFHQDCDFPTEACLPTERLCSRPWRPAA